MEIGNHRAIKSKELNVYTIETENNSFKMLIAIKKNDYNRIISVY